MADWLEKFAAAEAGGFESVGGLEADLEAVLTPEEMAEARQTLSLLDEMFIGDAQRAANRVRNLFLEKLAEEQPDHPWSRAVQREYQRSRPIGGSESEGAWVRLTSE